MKIRIRYVHLNPITILFFAGCVSVLSLGLSEHVLAGSKTDCDTANEDCQKIIKEAKPVVESKNKTTLIPQAQGMKGNAPIPQPSVLVNKQAK